MKTKTKTLEQAIADCREARLELLVAINRSIDSTDRLARELRVRKLLVGY